MAACTARFSPSARHAVLAFLLVLGATTWQSNAAAAASIVIESPGNEETVHDNLGRVTVSVKVPGAEPASAGIRLRPMLDGKPFGDVQRTPTFRLEGVERGTHTLQVQQLDGSGSVLAESKPVTFHMWQASRLFPGRK